MPNMMANRAYVLTMLFIPKFSNIKVRYQLIYIILKYASTLFPPTEMYHGY